MKACTSFFAACLVLLLTQCSSRPPHAPGDGSFSGDEGTAYRKAYYHGFDDAKHNRDDDFERYHQEYDDDSEKAFERGYAQGYEAGQEQADADDDAKDRTYNQGLELGRSDCENGRSPFYQRHASVYSSNTESSFRRGYVEGFKQSREDNGGASGAEQRAYDAGYRAGELDHERGRPLNTDTAGSGSDHEQREMFLSGYRDGYNHRTPRF